MTLRDAGRRVRLFDRYCGPGGRMSARQENDWQCDHGAQYFTARDDAFQAEVARWQHAGAAAAWPARVAVLNEPNQQSQPDEPNAGRQTRRIERFVGTPSMSAPARWLADALPLTTHCTIGKMWRDAHGWRLSSTEHGAIEETFDAVVLALPAPQAAPLLHAPSPELEAIARGTVMRACWALMLRFDERVPLPFDAAFVNDGPLRWIARDSSKPGRTGRETWLLHASAEWSDAHWDTPAARVAADLLDAFAQCGGPPPAAWTAHRWAHANVAPDGDPAPGYVWREADGLGMCGDWLNGGRVEGAWLSGRALGRAMVRALQSA
ncbi:FAD-dependent oxidoreductase [Paraburkholderia sp. PREW-6R]|uniref:NAD(P)/FAD-dependent oxidoreductase n=1 Tax=Paraburkholderia sp. PREW-6R TaxID=3141544 RepID=UPI0031F5BE28